MMGGMSWEKRMAERAAARAAEAAVIEDAYEEAEWRAANAEVFAEMEARRLAGPPCRTCYQWVQEIFTPYNWHWVDVGTRDEGWTRWCDCPCHPEPQHWEAVAIA